MKKTTKLLLIGLLIFQSMSYKAQTSTTVASGATNTITHQNSLTISPRIGYDLPFFQNSTPFIKYKGGIDLGLSMDYYWKWFGLGADFDYIRNKPKSTYDFTNLVGSGGLITSSTLIENKITRMFYGIGPNFRWQSQSGKFITELNTRIGLGGVKGGLVSELGNPGNDVLNFHSGYDFKNKLATKLQTKFTYYVNPKFGLNFGAYFINHLYGVELPGTNYSAAYQEINSLQGDLNSFSGGLTTRSEPCNCNIYSIGAFAGITYKIPTKPKTEECNACDTYSMAVTARDKFTKQLLPNTDVVLKNLSGEIIQTGTTNSYGVVVFNDIKPDNYTVDGLLFDVALDPASAAKSEFKRNQTLQKEIIYSDSEFILEGKAVECNTTKGIQGVKVKLFNKTEGVQKSTITDKNGKYILHVQQHKIYTIFGQKNSYFSQVETIDTKNFDRNTTLFVKIEICMEKVDCGTALKLQNIHYDLDKFFIREDAKPELDRLVQFMKDNPTLKVELSSHTDARSSHEYNQTLSQNRANAAVDYLVSQGIERNRLIAVGYGETKLLNECADGVNCSEDQHQLNRRTEMKVICPD